MNENEFETQSLVSNDSSIEKDESRAPAVALEKINAFLSRCLKGITVEVSAFLYVFAFSFHSTLTTNLILDKICLTRYNLTPSECLNESSSEESRIQVAASTLVMEKQLLENIPSVFVCLFLGYLSDIYGRKIPLILPFIGAILTSFIYLLNSYYFWAPPEYILIAALPFGLTGGFPTIFMAAYSYISDRTTPKQRTKRLAYIDATALLGPIAGSLLSVPAFSTLGYTGVFGICSGINLLGFLYSYFRLSESLPQPRDPGHEPERNRCVRCFTGVYKAVLISFKKRTHYMRAVILTTAVGMSICRFSFGSISMKYLYVKDKFFWTYKKYVILSVADCLSISLGMMVLLPILIKVFHVGSIPLLVAGCLSALAHYLLTGIAPVDWFLYIGAIASFFAFVPPLILRSNVSKAVPSEELGKIFSFFGCVDTIVPLISGPVLTLIYNSTIDTYSGTVFVVSSMLYIIVLLCTLPAQVLHKRSSAHIIQLEEAE